MRSALVMMCVATVAACGGGSAAHDAAPTVDATPTARVHLHWTYVAEDGSPLDCLAVGPNTSILVIDDDTVQTLDTALVPCASGDYLTVSVPVGATLLIRFGAVDDAGYLVATANGLRINVTHTGTIEADPMTMEIFDEPVPQMQQIQNGLIAQWPSPVTPTSQFPIAAANPAVDSCCPIICTPDPTIWTVSPWPQLGFVGPNRHYRWSYAVDSQGAGLNATFQIRAYADLDCDGVDSLWEIDGSVDPSGKVVAGPLQKIVQGE